MKRTKKILTIGLALLLMFSMTSCTPQPYKKIRMSDEYFEYELLEPKTIRLLPWETELYIIGLTEKGLQQTHLIIPESYHGYKIEGIGYQENNTIIMGNHVGYFRSVNLEKLYLDNDVTRSWEWALSEVHNLPNCYMVFWHTDFDVPNIPNCKGKIYGYNYYHSSIYPKAWNYIPNPIKIANISYLYNYDGAENDGYYWVDSYEQSVISFIPPKPQRDGYIFGGWYKESECINEWNFATDITGKEIVMEENKVYDTYDGIYLYAKWIEV